jgi:hypothetical protein
MRSSERGRVSLTPRLQEALNFVTPWVTCYLHEQASSVTFKSSGTLFDSLTGGKMRHACQVNSKKQIYTDRYTTHQLSRASSRRFYSYQLWLAPGKME